MPGSQTLAKLADWFMGPPRFRIAGSGGQAKCRLRPLRPTDIAICEEIYRLNEASHFPKGFVQRFTDSLGSSTTVFIVAEVNETVRGVAGLSMSPTLQHCIAGLAFGMVHPQYKGQGLGTSLLLARLAALPDSHVPCTVLMTSVGGSHTFYKRFGFRFFKMPAEFNEHGFNHYRVHFTPDDRKTCISALGDARVEKEGIRAAAEAARFAAFAQAAAASGQVQVIGH